VNDLENEKRESMIPLFKTVLDYIPVPRVVPDQDFCMLVTSLETDRHHGRYLTKFSNLILEF
jgi:predicted membrane GTPase involved in stress response